MKTNKKLFPILLLISIFLLVAPASANENASAVISTYEEEVCAELYKVIATTEVELNGKRTPGILTQETNLGDLVADSILWTACQSLGEYNNVVAIINAACIRATIKPGNICMATLKNVLTFGNEVVTADVTGAELLEILEAATYSTPAGITAFPQSSGINFTIDTTVPYERGPIYPDSIYHRPANPGNRIKNVTINGEPLDLAATYTVVTNDFVAGGGDTYGVFLDKEIHRTGIAFENAVADYIRNVLGNVITAEKYGNPAGRITIITETVINSVVKNDDGTICAKITTGDPATIAAITYNHVGKMLTMQLVHVEAYTSELNVNFSLLTPNDGIVKVFAVNEYWQPVSQEVVLHCLSS